MRKAFAVALAITALVAMNVPAWAQATEPGPSAVLGGRIITDLGYQNLSKELSANKRDDVTSAFLNVSGASYLRGSWTSADKTTGGLVELGVSAKVGDTENVALRYAYGWWRVGNCQLVAGQTDGWLGSPAYKPLQDLGIAQSAKTGLINFGYIYSARSPQVRFEWKSGGLGFSLAVAQPAAEYVTSVSGADMYANVPRLDLAAEFKAGGFMTTPAFGWSQLKYQGVAKGWDDSYNSWIAILPLKYSVGPFTAKVQVHTGANTESEWLGEQNTAMKSAPMIVPVFSATGKEYDTKESGGVIALEYTIGAFTASAGYGQVKIENDFWKKSHGYKNEDYTRSAWFVGFPYQVTKNFTVMPEFSYWMYGDSPATGKDMGAEWIGGIQFRFAF